ncbi:DUF5677 domain-containing protein [Saccharomonospora sp. CUA-673]|uniref:DUF5677 domain-containing protein n=1 Tax=Saccharomonospora sp. CUA-673 TaxID=1904969 RepID=UPI0011150AE2|nr:DUF5677 domain-containing protein [Saccharomonospora sp. CUA-673]
MEQPDMLDEQQELLKLLRSLLDSWQTLPPKAELCKGKTVAQVATVFGLAAHTHRLATAVDMLWSAGMYIESAPLIRGAMENALTAQFVAQVDDGVYGLLNNYARKRKNLVDEIVKAGYLSSDQLASQLDEWEPVQTPSTDSATKVQQLCNDLEPGGSQAYAWYRLLSAWSHAGGAIVDEYAHDDPFQLSITPDKFPPSTGFLVILGGSVVWAGRAYDMLTRGKGRREELRRAAGKIGIVPELHPSAAYRRRVQAEKKKRRSER